MAETRDWGEMNRMSARLLKERTGEDVEAWNQRIAKESKGSSEWQSTKNGNELW